jgi:glycosyltransferase involved in cell wall biosynthesis
MCFPHIAAGEFMKRELFLKTFFDQVDHFVSPSQFLIERYVDWGLRREKCTLLENGLILDDIAPPRPVARGGRRCRFAYFGQITRFKGVHVLLDAITRVPEADWGEDASVAFFGGNLENQPEDFQADFKALMERAGRRARFYGPYRAPEMPALMKDIDYVVVPSIWWENSPLVIQEAFAHGRPVISSNIGGMAEKVRNGIDGLHFRVGSTEDLVDRFVEVLREPQRWDQLRAKIRRPLGYQEAARQHQMIYRGLLGSRSQSKAANG